MYPLIKFVYELDSSDYNFMLVSDYQQEIQDATRCIIAVRIQVLVQTQDSRYHCFVMLRLAVIVDRMCTI